MLAPIDHFLDRITMYRLVLWYLIITLVAAGILGMFGILPYGPLDIVFSTLVFLISCWVANFIFSKVFGAATGRESVFITALILALIVSPIVPTDTPGIFILAFIGAWAMASKYLVAIGKRHLFNPAAFAVALSALVLGASATWWVGNVPLLPIVLIGGLLVVRKIRRFDLFLSFTLAAFATIFLTSSSGFTTILSQTLLHSSFFFLGLVMLTEPFTMPSSRGGRILYGALVGALFAPGLHFGSFAFTPELALLAGNLFAYLISPQGRYTLELVGRKELTHDSYEFSFRSDRPLAFIPGQYLEWTLPHARPDDRGNRRYFTIASSPGEERIKLGVKFFEPASSFKQALARMKSHEYLAAGQLAGDFTLPRDEKRKLAFIAGGIGITPFRSQVQDLLDRGERRDAILLYGNKTAADIAYKELFDEAQAIGLTTYHFLSSEPALPPYAQAGMINAAAIRRVVPDFAERTFYVSGSQALVNSSKRALRELGVHRWNIKTDYFPGLA